MSRSLRHAVALVLCITGGALVACAHNAASKATLAVLPLTDTGGKTQSLAQWWQTSPISVFVFFSDRCPCYEVHEGRLKIFAANAHKQGVAVYAVASEYGATLAVTRAAKQTRDYPFDILLDEGGALAGAWDVEFAGYVIMVDARGTLLYRGAFDSDETDLQEDATPYAARALAQALDGRTPEPFETPPIGCTLRRW